MDSRISSYLTHQATDSTEFLDDREAELLNVCTLIGQQRESLLADFFNSEADGYFKKWTAFSQGEIEVLQQVHREDVVQTARCAASMIACDRSFVVREPGAPVKQNIYDNTLPLSIYFWKVVARNTRWAAKFDAALSPGGRLVYAMVGIGHLPSFRSGKNLDPGLLEQMAAKGYTVSPITSFGDIWDAKINLITTGFILSRTKRK